MGRYVRVALADPYLCVGGCALRHSPYLANDPIPTLPLDHVPPRDPSFANKGGRQVVTYSPCGSARRAPVLEAVESQALEPHASENAHRTLDTPA